MNDAGRGGASGSGLAPRGVTIVHDHLTEMGGAERVVEALLSMFPQATLHSSAFRPPVMPPSFAARGVRTSFLGGIAADKARAKRFFPLFPLAFRRMRLDASDLVISSSSAFAHHVRPPAGALHVCYCYTPPRFLWQSEEYFRDRAIARWGLESALAGLRALDRRAAGRVDEYVAVSAHTARRISGTYGRQATVIHPPVDVDAFRPSEERSGRFLVVSRLLAYKRIDLAIRAAAMTGSPLDVIGEGPHRSRLERVAGPTVRFLGRLPDVDVRRAMARCTALLVPGTEDFGLTPVEVQASGRPPIAFAAGGALETIEDGVTGFLVEQATPEAFARAMVGAAAGSLPPRRLVAAATRFDRPVFERRLAAFLRDSLERHAARARTRSASETLTTRTGSLRAPVAVEPEAEP
jgi:glycosyltransferase involved in cell wall biosynthesis